MPAPFFSLLAGFWRVVVGQGVVRELKVSRLVFQVVRGQAFGLVLLFASSFPRFAGGRVVVRKPKKFENGKMKARAASGQP